MSCLSIRAETSGSNHWAFQTLNRPPVPESEFSSPVDAFAASVLKKHGRSIHPEADRRTLIRRLSFDLRGVPPALEEIEAFLKDRRADAFERLVESFLGSPQYGERWGRHWLDLTGYADSNGYFSADSDRPLAWKYRDYVVRSLNADKPLDRFIQEQIAGDELAGYVAGGDVTQEMVDPLIATHFWRNAPDGTGESDGNPLEVKVDKYAVIEGDVQILGSAFLGLTLQCARCHDHKFEPVKQEEFYGLQAILRPAFDPDHWMKPNERVIEIGTRAEREAHQRKTAEVSRDLKIFEASLEGLTAPFRKQAIDENLAGLDPDIRKKIQEALDTKEKNRTDAMRALLKANAAQIEISDEALQKRFPAYAAAAAPLRDALQRRTAEKPAPLEKISVTFERADPPPAHHLLVRGNHATEGKVVPPTVPAIFHVAFSSGKDAPVAAASSDPGGRPPGTSGRRLSLARWLTSPENPIVARALVNRVWRYHFGEGLVSTTDNLGRSGARPIAPELLDWLARELIDSGWSLKHLHRLILTSATWRQSPGESSSQNKNATPAAAESGVSLRALTFDEARRLDAESLRDAMLSVSGELDAALGGPYIPTKPDQHGQIVIDENQPGAHRRSIYLQQRRTAPVNFLATFDGPAHNPVCVQRVNSTVALQSLSLLNSEFVRSRARAFARRVFHATGWASEPARRPELTGDGEMMALNTAFGLAYGRPPEAAEFEAAKDFLRTQRAIYQNESDAPFRVWTDLCQMLLASNTFLYVD